MVRSHNKLDSMGVEYGRLGSATFAHRTESNAWDRGSVYRTLPAETRDAIRLLGGAALPGHFPPFVGLASYYTLTNKRVANILRNTRRSAQYFTECLPRSTERRLHFAHGLYVTLSEDEMDEAKARQTATDMGDDLRTAFPIRHAGSFGFDFAAVEWFHNSATNQYSVRIAAADLPTQLWDNLTKAITEWWMKRFYQPLSCPNKSQDVGPCG